MAAAGKPKDPERPWLQFARQVSPETVPVQVAGSVVDVKPGSCGHAGPAADQPGRQAGRQDNMHVFTHMHTQYTQHSATSSSSIATCCGL